MAASRRPRPRRNLIDDVIRLQGHGGRDDRCGEGGAAVRFAGVVTAAAVAARRVLLAVRQRVGEGETWQLDYAPPSRAVVLSRQPPGAPP